MCVGDREVAAMLIHCRPARVIRSRRAGEPRLAVYIRDAAKRSSWPCKVALLQYAIQSANDALLEGFDAR
jgi:hypothetical protein